MIRLGTGGGFNAKYIYRPFPLSELKRHVATWQTFIEGTDGWHTVFCENHDNGRAVSRFGDDSTPELWAASAKTLALWQATLTGSLFLYQGQEIGMTNVPKDWGIEEYKDVESNNFYAEAVASGDAKRVKATMEEPAAPGPRPLPRAVPGGTTATKRASPCPEARGPGCGRTMPTARSTSRGNGRILGPSSDSTSRSSSCGKSSAICSCMEHSGRSSRRTRPSLPTSRRAQS